MKLSLWALDLEAWRASLEPSAAAVMSPEEREMARSFRHEGARAQYLGARLLARTLLGHRLGVPPAALRFHPGPLGKPRLEGHPGLHYNLSHSGDLVVCAISGAGPVGVDVEPFGRRPPLAELAQAHFAPAEAAWIRARPALAQRRFLALWTLKEACLKQSGQGIGGGLAGLTFRPSLGGRMVPSDPGLPCCRLSILAGRAWLAVCGAGLEVRSPRAAWFRPRGSLGPGCFS